MPFCPKCRYEFMADALVCPDCNETLVESLPPRNVTAVIPDDSWVVVGSVGTRAASEIVKGSLDSNNIPSVVMSRQFMKTAKVGNPMDQTLIMVPKEFLSEAQIILESVLDDDPSGSEYRP